MIRKKTFLHILLAVTFLFTLSLPSTLIARANDSVKSPQVALGSRVKLHNTSIDHFGKETDVFLIISSFNPDTRRTVEYIAEFENSLANSYPNNYIVLVEDLAAKDFSNDAYLWESRIKRVVDKYLNRNLKAIIAIGQEAWAGLISQTEIPNNIPVFGTFISTNGIDLPKAPIDETWETEWINTARKARANFYTGGSLVSYSCYKNIELIQSYFPETENVFLVTDNTYGGVSIKAYFKYNIEKLPPLNYQYLDSRLNYFSELKQAIKELPKNSAILLATWKVNKDGQYYLPNSLEDLLSPRPDIPVFTLTGTGLENVAIGGYIPQYLHSATTITNQIINYELGNLDSLRFINDGGLYKFNQTKVKEFKLDEKTLPLHSKLINLSDPRIKTYKRYLYIISFITLILAFFIVALTILHTRNRKLRHKLERNSQELIKAKEMAEESDRLKSAFLANMSHEIRTPLNAIVGFSNLLSKTDFPTKEREKATTIIARNSELLLTLITDILDISGLEAGKMKFLLKEASINDICNQVVETTNCLKKEGVQLQFIPSEQELIVKTDVHRLSQVLLNLITNSYKFTDKGTITLKYKVQKNKTILFSITDTGIGIPRQQQCKLFERFGKLNHFKQGNGLGLAISRLIVNRLGGEIWIDPNYTEGARFFFTHPL